MADISIELEKIGKTAVYGSDMRQSLHDAIKTVNEDIITGDRIASKTITTSNIGDKQITNAKIADGAVDGRSLANGAVIYSKINNGAVIESKIAENAVATWHIQDEAITMYKIADGAIDEYKIDDGAVCERHLKNGVVTVDKVAEGAITRDKIANGNDVCYGTDIIPGTNSWLVSDVLSAYPGTEKEVIQMYNYTSTPTRVGTWMGNTPIWRVAFDTTLAEIDISDGVFALPIPVKDFLSGTLIAVLNSYVFTYPNDDYSLACRLLEENTSTSAYSAYYFKLPSMSKAGDVVRGYVEFVAAESNIETS